MRRLLVAGLVLALTLAAAGAGSGAWFRRQVDAPFPADGVTGAAPRVLVVEAGASASTVAAQLESSGIISSARLFGLWLRWRGEAAALQAGEYAFDGDPSMAQVATILVSGRVRLQSVTIREGIARWEVAEALVEAGFGPADEALAATERGELIADLDEVAALEGSLEGYLYPDTYLAPRSATPADLVAEMVGRVRALWTPARQARAAELEMTLREVITLASMVEAEAQLAAERPLIAAVFHRRIERSMLLQCDPTVLYARWLAGKGGRVIHRSDLERDSPYNTYRYPGLPAGPIGNPREASIDAVLYPADADNLYFVARNDGSHVFSRSLVEHNRNVNLYQR